MVQAVPRMDALCAEQLVQKWQVAKAQALGQDHAIEKLSEVSFVDICLRIMEASADCSCSRSILVIPASMYLLLLVGSLDCLLTLRM